MQILILSTGIGYRCHFGYRSWSETRVLETTAGDYNIIYMAMYSENNRRHPSSSVSLPVGTLKREEGIEKALEVALEGLKMNVSWLLNCDPEFIQN